MIYKCKEVDLKWPRTENFSHSLHFFEMMLACAMLLRHRLALADSRPIVLPFKLSALLVVLGNTTSFHDQVYARPGAPTLMRAILHELR